MKNTMKSKSMETQIVNVNESHQIARVSTSELPVTVLDTKESNIGELRGLLASVRESAANVAIVNIPRYLLTIDPRYQTDVRTNRSLNYLVRRFDRRKMMPLLVVPHDDEGLLYIVDGYGRYKATELIDKEQYAKLPCMVVLDAPSDPEARLMFEAEMYAYQNREVARLRPLQKHGAFECLKDDAALILDKLTEEYGLELPIVGGRQKHAQTGIVGAYSRAYNICQRQGEDCFRYILETCKRGGFNVKASGYASWILTALRDIWKEYPDDRQRTSMALGAWMRQLEPLTLKAQAIAKYPMLAVQSAVSMFVEDMCVDMLKLPQCRVVEGKKIKQVA